MYIYLVKFNKCAKRKKTFLVLAILVKLISLSLESDISFSSMQFFNTLVYCQCLRYFEVAIFKRKYFCTKLSILSINRSFNNPVFRGIASR